MTDSPVNGLTQEEYDFIAAVINDEMYELDINDEYVLHTDEEGDEYFLPSVTILHLTPEEHFDDEEANINRFLADYSWFKYKEVMDFQRDEHAGLTHAYFFDPEIDSDVKDSVKETL